MNYKLNFQSETYLVEDIHIPTEPTLAQESIGKTFSFVSPVRLPIGQRFVLRGDSGGYQLLVERCVGFQCSPRFLVSGIIANKEAAAASAVDGTN